MTEHRTSPHPPVDATPPEGASRAADQQNDQDEDDQTRRERMLRLGFGGDREKYDTFVTALRDALPPTVGAALRGSSVTGHRYADGQPFDADGPGTSDLDLALLGGDALKLWRDDAFYIPTLHTKPLCDDDPDCAPPLTPLRRALSRIAGRPVNIQGTADMVMYVRDVLFGEPFVVILERADDADAPVPVPAPAPAGNEAAPGA